MGSRTERKRETTVVSKNFPAPTKEKRTRTPWEKRDLRRTLRGGPGPQTSLWGKTSAAPALNLSVPVVRPTEGVTGRGPRVQGD